MKHLLLSVAVLLLLSRSSFSQDKIYRNNGKVVEAKIIEIGSDEIKYKEFQNPDGPIYILETDKIKKIVFENGVFSPSDQKQSYGLWSMGYGSLTFNS